MADTATSRDAPKHYVLDTGFFIFARRLYPSVFPSFWKDLDEAVKKGIVSPVHAVMQEIESYRGEQGHLLEWIRTNGHIFTLPSEEEQEKIKAMIYYYPDSHIDKKIKNYHYWADVWLIAKAWHLNATLVTTEKSGKDRNQEAKIPYICDKLGIRCIGIEEFMLEMGWRYCLNET